MINPELNELLNDPKIKFTVILGSGFHREGLGDYSILSNWSALLSRLTTTNNLTGKFTLDFEAIVLDKCKANSDEPLKRAHEVEKQLLDRLAKLIQNEQKYVGENLDSFSYPDLFSGNKISDVVSLNFDTLPEKFFLHKIESSEKYNESSFHIRTKENKLSDSFITQNTSFEKYQNQSGHIIRFWHPHGTIDNPKHMVLGISNYSKLVSALTKIRNHYKANEDYDLPNKELTWFSRIVQNPVLILGASMSQMEWAMWTAVVYKFRNYARSKREGFFPIFQMMEIKHGDQLKNDWIQPLFTDMSYDKQWEQLKKIFAKKINSTK
jgi:hypothetical protein